MSQLAPSLQSAMRAPLLWVLVPWMTGFWLADRFDAIDPIIFAGIALFGISLSMIVNRLHWWSAFFVIGSCSAGGLYYNVLEVPRKAKEPFLSMPIREIELILEVTRAFDREDPYDRVSGVAKIRKTPSVRQDLLGKRTYFQLKAKEPGLATGVSKGMFVRAKGLLKPLPRHADKGFDRYLSNAGVAYQFRRGAILEMTQSPDWFRRFCRIGNEKLEAVLRHAETEASTFADVGVAMILGKKRALGDERKNRYVDAGVMHLFAISGLHVGVVAAAMAFILRWLPGPKWMEAFCGLGLLLLYVEITGGTPSARRAFFMVTFWWGTQLLGRPGFSLPALTASAFATLLFNPRELWNLGFQLSYCVVAAIILYGVPLASRLQAAWEPWAYLHPKDRSILQRGSLLSWKWFVGALSVSFAATLASAPLIMDHFGVFTPGAILLNVFLVPLAGLSIICGFASIFCGLTSLILLSTVINHGQWALLWLMDVFVRLFLAIPGLFLRVEVASSNMASVALVVTLIIFIFLVRRLSVAAVWICLLPLFPLCLLFFFASEVNPIKF